MANYNDGQIHESDLTLPILRFLATEPSGFLATSELIVRLEYLFKPIGKDAETINGRGDTHFSQKVRNVVSHRDSPSNPIARGWIKYNSEAQGLKITNDGLAAFKSYT